MSDPRYLEVVTTEQQELEKGESGLSSANVTTEAREIQQTSNEPTGVYVANENVIVDNSKSLRVTPERPAGKYQQNNGDGQGFSRSTSEKKSIVNTITVDETKCLIGLSEKETKAYIDKLIKTIREGQYVKVDTETYPTLESFLASTGEQGTVYLYPLDNEGNNYDQYIWENGEWVSLGSTEVDLSSYYTKTESDEKYVDLTSNQTITGTKTILGTSLQFKNTNNSTYAYGFEADDSNLYFERGTVKYFRFQTGFFGPLNSNTRDLGTPSAQWKDLYIAGYLKGLTTLTQAQYDALVSGGTVDANTLYLIEE